MDIDPLGLADRSWPILRRLMGLHTVAYRATGGLVGHRFPGAPPMLLLDHVGAKSGIERTTPLVYVEDGDDLVLVASKGGYPRNPAWFHNLRAPPRGDGAGGLRVEGRCALTSPGRSERDRLWPKAVAVYGGYEDYQERTDREIPLVILEPR